MQKTQSDFPVVSLGTGIRLANAPAGWIDVGTAITLEGQLAVLRVACDQAELPLWQLTPPIAASIDCFDRKGLSERLEFTLNCRLPCAFDKLVDGRWILKSYHSEGLQESGQLVSADGVSTMCAVDGNADFVAADPDGGYWIAYDETSGFKPQADHSFAHDTLVRFSSDGERLWGFNAPDSGIKTRYVDCLYAINISPLGRFAYLWPDHVVAKLDGPKTRFWRPGVDFADAFATNGRQMLFATWDGKGNRKRATVSLDWLDPPSQPNSRKLLKMWRAVLDRRLERHQLMCRGDSIHCIDKGKWYSLSMDDAQAQIPESFWKSPLRKEP